MSEISKPQKFNEKIEWSRFPSKIPDFNLEEWSARVSSILGGLK